MMKIKATLLFLIFHTLLFAQNLVPNSSFESYTHCPTTYSQFEFINNWTLPNSGTTDLYSNCEKELWSHVSVPHNFFGWQAPQDGNAYVGIYTYYHDDYREYLQIELADTLVKDAIYTVQFYSSLADNCGVAIKSLGVSFQEGSIYQDNFENLSYVHQTIKIDTFHQKNKRDWVLLQTYYTAKGGETHLIIGNFKNNIETDTLKLQDTLIHKQDRKAAYYFIDNVCVARQMPNGLCYCDLDATANFDVEKLLNSEEETYTNLYLFSGAEDGLEVPKVGDKIVLNNIYFETAKANLLERSRIELEALLSLLKRYPNMEILIGGHTDSQGLADYNLELSNRRAKAVFTYLINHNIQSKRIQYKGFGELYPITENNTPEGRQENRRVEFTILKK